MKPNDFADDPEFDGTIGPELKHTIRKTVREAIIWQNKQVLFNCSHCVFHVPADHKKGRMDRCLCESAVNLNNRQASQMPECFQFDPLKSAFAGVLTLMYFLGVDTVHTEHGWPTIIGRLAARADRFGYITGVTAKNLERYGA